VKLAADKTVETARDLAAEALEAARVDIEDARGRFSVTGADRGIGPFERAARRPDARILIVHSNAVSGPSWPNGGHICVVEITPDTGEVSVALRGIGQALCEEIIPDAERSQPLPASVMDHAMPRADVPEDHAALLDQGCLLTTNALGANGVGELGTIGATPAGIEEEKRHRAWRCRCSRSGGSAAQQRAYFATDISGAVTSSTSSNSFTASISVPIAMFVWRSRMNSITTGTWCSSISARARSKASANSLGDFTRMALQPRPSATATWSTP
jgi:hypothetical protein